MHWIKLRNEILENAVVHSWCNGCGEESRKAHEVITLIHSELLKALEEYQARRWCGI